MNDETVNDDMNDDTNDELEPEHEPEVDHDFDVDSPVVARIRAVIAPIVSDLGLELYDLEYGAGLLKVTVDTPPGSPGGVDVDQLTRCTRLINREFEHNDPTPGNYTLEVSSPGLERNLRLPRHFQREIGKTVAVRLRDVVNGERRLTGVLVSADADGFTVRLDDLSDRTVGYHQVDRARTVFVWQATPKPGGKGAKSGAKSTKSGKSGKTGASGSPGNTVSTTESPSATAELPAETVQESDES